MFSFVLIVLAVVVALVAAEVSHKHIYVCDATNPKLLGEYVATETRNDGVPVYTNANDLSFFRNRKFWYMGNMA